MSPYCLRHYLTSKYAIQFLKLYKIEKVLDIKSQNVQPELNQARGYPTEKYWGGQVLKRVGPPGGAKG